VGIKARVLCLAFRKNLCVQIKDLRKNKGQRKINSKKKLASPLLFSLSLSLSLSSLRPRSLLLFRVGASNCNVQNEGVNVSC
jgi:hypothetical protein